MSTLSITDKAISQDKRLIFLVLVVAGLAGNYFKFLIFLNVDFLFGSIFSMLALQYFGFGPGVLAAGLIASYTYILWNHPYAILIMLAEVAVVGWLNRRRNMELVLADVLYWLFIGMPLVFVFYHLVMQVSFSNAVIVLVKQAVNGVTNTLIARLIFTSLVRRSGSELMSFREVVYNLLALFVLAPALIMLAINSRAEFAETNQAIRTSLLQDSQRLSYALETWVVNRKYAIINLAEMATSRSPQQMQSFLEQTKKSDFNFLRVGLQDKEAKSVAYFPMIDELGQSNIGKDFSDRPFVPKLKQNLKPMLSEVVMGRIGTPEPIVIMLAPVVISSEFGGYIAGVLSLEQLRQHLVNSTNFSSLFYTLLDKNGNIIMSNRTDQKVMTPFMREEGTLIPFADGVNQWVPQISANTPATERWKNSLFFFESPIGNLAEWKLLLEQPVAPFQKKLYDKYSRQLILMFLILLAALLLAKFISRRATAALERLSMLTHELPVKIAKKGQMIVWPDTAVEEVNKLISNFKDMGDSLTAQFEEVIKINLTLEQRVDERTEELRESERKLSEILESVDACIYLKDTQGHYLFANRRMRELIGLTMQDIVGQADESIFDAATAAQQKTYDRQVLVEGKTLRLEESHFNRKDNCVSTYHSVKIPLRDSEGHIYALCGVCTDITERKQIEDQVRQMAFYDPLTRLPNRRLLSDRLSQVMAASKRSACYSALMFLDLDNFKPLNDAYGHEAGDLLLIEVAARLKSCVRETDTVARLGGDEFVVIVGEMDSDIARSTAQARIVAEKICFSLSEPYHLSIRREVNAEQTLLHYCSASIGVVLFVNDETEEHDILKWADEAMYLAKKAGRNKIRFHAEGLEGCD